MSLDDYNQLFKEKRHPKKTADDLWIQVRAYMRNQEITVGYAAKESVLAAQVNAFVTILQAVELPEQQVLKMTYEFISEPEFLTDWK